jgi:branched-chain amino acid transport system ATP-binding protein
MDLIARLCDPVIVLAEGSVLTQGTMNEVRRDARVLDAYLGGEEAA